MRVKQVNHLRRHRRHIVASVLPHKKSRCAWWVRFCGSDKFASAFSPFKSYLKEQSPRRLWLSQTKAEVQEFGFSRGKRQHQREGASLLFGQDEWDWNWTERMGASTDSCWKFGYRFVFSPVCATFNRWLGTELKAIRKQEVIIRMTVASWLRLIVYKRLMTFSSVWFL